ncbi:MAG: hypothetical protein HYV28_15995 [Ignavibacteriales bacterium]|nr:hypothetical protein [Ignavibacteriales bacterium]
MYIISDTSSIIMLIRIVPGMFTDSKFACETIREVKNELTATQKFRGKYPWLRKIVDKIFVTEIDTLEQADFITAKKAVDVTRKMKEDIYNLSETDATLVTYAHVKRRRLLTEDRKLSEFAKNEFDNKPLQTLELLNNWIEKNLITIDDDKNEIVKDWRINNEPAQPEKEKKRYKRLTGYEYEGI